MSVKEPMLNHWYRALASPLGIELSTSDAEAVRQKLYAARREAQDPDLDKVSVCVSPFDPMKLWLIRREPSDAT